MCSEEKSRDTEEEDICPTGLKANFQGEQSNRNAQKKPREGQIGTGTGMIGPLFFPTLHLFNPKAVTLLWASNEVKNGLM